MIEILTSIANSILHFFNFFISTITLALNSIFVLLKLSILADQWFFLVPGFLSPFALLFFVLFIVNRFSIGRN